MEFRYTLRKSEYEDYYKCRILKSPEMRKLQHRAWTILPVVLLLLLAGIRPHAIWWYLGAVVLSLLWILLVNWRVAVRIKQGAEHEMKKITRDTLQRMTLRLDDKSLKINGRLETVKNYAIFSDLILIMLADDSVIILPSRVFEGNEDAMREALRILRDQADAYVPPELPDDAKGRRGRRNRNKNKGKQQQEQVQA